MGWPALIARERKTSVEGKQRKRKNKIERQKERKRQKRRPTVSLED